MGCGVACARAAGSCQVVLLIGQCIDQRLLDGERRPLLQSEQTRRLQCIGAGARVGSGTVACRSVQKTRSSLQKSLMPSAPGNLAYRWRERAATTGSGYC
jgi:hypothetical protein